MCLAVPMKLVEVTGAAGRADLGGVRRAVALDLVPGASVGDYVLVHAGFAIQVMDEAAAAETIAMLREVAQDPDAPPGPPGDGGPG
ncbi:MAG: HypC/HybG/HupF family hydrogenase formation chaperone [Deltaproteobacteria bacterium]|nr:HypC/HybG/HupF family hydrogenase formation chaperone [Deltaproteobacteria bacterium]